MIPSFSGSGSDISRAATFGSASESSTPFISPQGTPIPFNRFGFIKEFSLSSVLSGLGIILLKGGCAGAGIKQYSSDEIVFSSIYCKTSDYSNVRHSSGLPVYARYQQPAMPYSPMALNNLNNPFSPQVTIFETLLT